VRRALLAALVAVGLFLGVSAPAQAAVTGTIVNGSPSGHLIYTTSTWPTITNQGALYPGFHRSGKGFMSAWNCYSTWGYRYAYGRWHEMTTTGNLLLNCH